MNLAWLKILFLMTRNTLGMFISGMTIYPSTFIDITPPSPVGVSAADYLRGYLNAVLAHEFIPTDYVQDGFTWTMTFVTVTTGDIHTLKVRLV